MKLTQEEMMRIMTNPFYCLEKIDPMFRKEHETIVTEEEFIKAGVKLIEEVGAEIYISNLLESLKGNYVSLLTNYDEK